MTFHHGVTLTFGGTASSPNPFTVTSLVYASPGYGLLSNGIFDQVYPHNPPYTLPAWTVLNHNTVGGPGNSGIYLRNGGTVVNYPSAFVFGAIGIAISRYSLSGPTGTVINAGTIFGNSGDGVDLAAGAATNSTNALIAGKYAVSISGAGTVTNYGALQGSISGIVLYGGGTVTNYGTVSATSLYGVLLQDGGTVHNLPGSAGSVALIEGYYSAILATHGAGTGGDIAIYNVGTLIGTRSNGIWLQNGGFVGNSGTISGGSTRAGVYSNVGYTRVENDGTIRGFAGVNVAEGYVKNTGTGLIDGGVNLRGGYGTVLNERTAGAVPSIMANTAVPAAAAVQLYGILLNSGYVFGEVIDQTGVFGTVTVTPTVSNSGVMTGLRDAVSMRSLSYGRPYPTGMFSNIGTLTGFGTVAGANGVVLSHLTGTVANAGDILGSGTTYSSGYGLRLAHSDGTIQNAGAPYHGLIYGYRTAVSVYYGSATTTNFGTIEGGVGFASVGGTYSNTLINFGTIIGTGGHAVQFGHGNNLLIDEPGAVFSGDVTALSGTHALELASGASSGTLHGLSSTFKDFASVTIDAGADWYIDGSNLNGLTFQPATLINHGILNVTPGGRFTARGSIASAITLHAGSTLAVNSGATIAAQGTGAVVVVADPGGSVVNYGLIDPPSAIGVTMLAAGTVMNGSRFSSSDTIVGYQTAVDLGSNGGSLVNYGTVRALGSVGVAVHMGTGDVVLNGITGSGTALITGVLGISDNGGTIVNGSTARTTGIIYGSTYAIAMSGTGAALTNFASIMAPLFGGTVGVSMHAGILNNATGGAGSGYIRALNGVDAYSGTIANDGTIFGAGGVGISFAGSGTIINGSIAGTAALIDGSFNGISITNGGTPGIIDAVTVINAGIVSGIGVNGAFATVINSSTIAGDSGGIVAQQSALPTIVPTLNITNTASGVIRGTIGIQANGRTDLFDAGTIIGTGGTAVSLGAADDSVTLAPGAAFVGSVDAGLGQNLLELTGPLPGTLSGFDAFFGTITNFTTLMTDANATWDLAGNSLIGLGVSLINQGAIQAGAGDHLTILADITPQAGSPSVVQVLAGGTIGVYGSVASGQTLSFASSLFGGGEFQIGNPSAFGGTIAGFVVYGPTIDLPGLTANGARIVSNVLEVRVGGSYVVNLPVTGSFTNTRVLFGSDGAGGTALTLANAVACFAAGTRLLTSRGHRAIETLREGDPVWAALQRRYVPTLWIGHRRIDCHHHPKPEHVWPVRIAAGAFGNRCPARDVLLSPDHAVFIEDVLIPIRLLIDGTSISQAPVDVITYYHIELPTHDIVLAEGLPAESYLDAGARDAFDNGDGALMLHPDFAAQRWEAAGCAPLIVSGPRLAAARKRLRAQTLASSRVVKSASALQRPST